MNGKALERIISHRTRRADLARETKIDKQRIRKFISGRAMPTLEEAQAIGKALNMSSAEFCEVFAPNLPAITRWW